MTLLEVRVRLQSPAIVTTRRTERGFVRPADHIPGSTLRGAILSALYREGKLDLDYLKQEAKSPGLLASPAYPLCSGAKSLPATPSIRRCDDCNGYEYVPPGVGQPAKEHHECGHQSGGQQGAPGPGRHGRVKSVWMLRTLHGSLLANVNGEPVDVRPKTFRATSVAIDKRRRASAKGMLFDYEAIAEGTEFWAWVLIPDRVAGRVELDGLEVAVGRGQSRGFGRAILSVRSEVQPSPDLGSDQWYVAISPLTPVRSLKWGDCTVELKEVEGRVYFAQMGWDIAQGRLRPFVEVAKRGSLVLARLSGSGCDQVLRVGIPVEVDGFCLTGLNALIPLSEYESILGVKRSHE